MERRLESEPSLSPSGSGAPPWAPGYRHLTSEERGIHFAFRERLEDFVVEELPEVLPAGHGDHTWIHIEKRGISTDEAARRLARALERPLASLRWSGRKDARAIARQWVSVPGLEPQRALEAAVPGLKVLGAARHPERLRLGRTRGNRFTLRLRRVPHAERPILERVCARVREEGLPNYYGEQRFGIAGRAHELGRLLVERRWNEYVRALVSPEHTRESEGVRELRLRIEDGRPAALRSARLLVDRLPPELRPLALQLGRRRDAGEPAVRSLDRRLLRLHLSAFQSQVFNAVLARRMQVLGIDTLRPGDLAFRHADRELVAVESPAAWEEQLQALAVSPSGPLPGSRHLAAGGEPGRIEEQVFAEEGVEPQAFGCIGLGLDRHGARRPLRVPVRDLVVRWEGADAILSFELPAGSYATTLIEELTKSWRS